MIPPESADADVNPGYERRDVRIAPLVWLGLTIFVGTTAVFIALWFLLAVLENQASRADPKLQDTPVEDLQRLHERDEAILTTHGWSDEDKQSVRIPIVRAMDLAVERGLPAPKLSNDPQGARE
jgi:hypothetical protein